MATKPGVRDALWMAAGAVLFLVLTLALLHFHTQDDPAAQIAAKARKIELVDRMRVALASASAAEKSSVLAVTDEDSERFADEARTAAKAVDDARQELRDVLLQSGTDHERQLLDQFLQVFSELHRVDDDVLRLAVQNTNLKAYALAYGPAAGALDDMTRALTAVSTADADPATGAQVPRLALGAAIAALRVQTMIPPHIAEESDEKMDQMEAAMAKDEEKVRGDLDDLQKRPELRDNSDLRMATSSWARFGELKVRILALSRENTNVRSLTMSLDRKRKLMVACQDALAAVRRAIDEEPIRGLKYAVPVKPR